MQIIDPAHHKIIKQIKSILLDLSGMLEKMEGSSKDISLIKDLIINLDDLFLIVVAGEYNSGKSEFINALLGGNYLKTGVTPTTTDINILRYAEEKQEKMISEGQKMVELPVDLLQDVSIVDTPGTNAVLREHEALTTDFIPRSDLVIFITSVDRPFTESERAFLERIRSWGKKIAVIINKSDIVTNQNEMDEIRSFVGANFEKLLGYSPQIFSLSARASLSEKKQSGKSGEDLKKVEDYIFQTLDPGNKLCLKLMNPLGVTDNLLSKYSEILQSRYDLIQNDITLINDINQQLDLFKEDMMRSFQFRYADIDNALLEYEKRGIDFFEDTFRIGRILDLLNKQRIQAEYNDQVVKRLSKEIDSKVGEMIDWLVQEDLRQWHSITYKIDQRISEYEERILEDGRSRQIRFERQKIIDTVKRETQKVIDCFDQPNEAKRIAKDAQMAVAASAAIEAGALGLGALVTILATTASADLTGILLAGLTATLGFFIIPAKKRQAKALFIKNISEIRDTFSKSLTDEFQKQIDTVIDNIENTIAPYTRFISAEQANLGTSLSKIDHLSSEVFKLKQEVENM